MFPCIAVLASSARKMKNSRISQDHEGIDKATLFRVSPLLLMSVSNSFALRYANPFHGHLSRYLAKDIQRP